MTPQGPRPPGGGPGDPDGDPNGVPDGDDGEVPAGERFEDALDGTGPGAGQRGWLDPDDRLWRHPSELGRPHGTASGDGSGGTHRPGGAPPGWAPDGGAPAAPGAPRRRQRVATVLVGSGAAAAVVALGLLLLVGASGSPDQLAATGSSASTSVTVVTGCCSVVPATERGARDAMVSLVVATDDTVDHVCGVVVGAGGLVATTLDALAGARSVTAVTATGERLPASVVAGDPTSDIALVRVPEDLPVARFSADAAGAAGRRAIVMAATSAFGPGTGVSTVTMWTAGTIRSVGVTVSSGPASGMAGIETATGSRPAMAGEVLLDRSGQVLGILDSSGTADGTAGAKVFLPAQLVVGVARSLATAGYVDHGWLDIEGADSPARSITTTSTSTAQGSRGSSSGHAQAGTAGGGAVVEAVEAGGASAGALRPGEVIRSIDGEPVHSMAELRDRLYVLPPGDRVVLGITADGSARSVAVVLSASP